MKDFIFENSTKAIFGRDAVKKHLPEILAHYGKAVLLAYGNGSIKRNGIYTEVMEILRGAGKKVVEFSGIMPNPTYAKVLEGVQLARENHIDLILAVGGGSTMDCCKAVSIGSVYQGKLWEDFWAVPGEFDFVPLPLGIIETVSGTGSEMNGGAVISNEELHIKTGRDYPQANARFVLQDPSYTLSVPLKQVAAGAFDTLSHLMEIYFSEPVTDNVSDDMAEALMRSTIRNLRQALQKPEDYEARSNLMWASTMAENRIIKLGKKTDFQCHMLEHQLAAYTDCNHGCGLAVLHPVYYRKICEVGRMQFAKFAVNVWGIDASGRSETELARAGVEKLSDFVREIGLPTTLRELGLKNQAQLTVIADSCLVASGSLKPLTRAEIREIFAKAF